MATAAEIADALAGRFGPVTMRIRYSQRDHDFVLITDITSAVSRCVIELDNDRRAVRTASFTFQAENLPVGFDVASDHVGVTAEVLVDGVFIEFPLGLFHLDVPDRAFTPGEHQEIEIKATDLTTHLLTATLGTPLTIAAATNYRTAIEARLDGLNLNHLLPPVTDVTPIAFTWGPEATEADVVDALAFAINHYPVWPNPQGTFITRERINPSDETPDVAYATTFEPRMILGDQPFTKEEDRTRFANRIAVLIDNPNRAAAFAVRQNSDPTSPISTVALGVTVTEELSGGRVVDTTVAGEIAEFEIRDRVARSLTGRLWTLFDPRREAHESYTLFVESEEGGTLWRANGWTLPLTTEGAMEHKLGKPQNITVSTP